MIHAARNAAREAVDADARLRVLADCADRLMGSDATARDWVLLAAAWQDADERDAAYHYLEHARACARDADDRCFVAAALLRLDDRGAAEDVMIAAQAIAGDAHAWCTIGSAWRYAFGDRDRRAACFAHARAIAASVDQLELAIRTDDDPPKAAIAAGEDLAQTPADWHQLAGLWARTGSHADADRCRSLARGAGPVRERPSALLRRGVRSIGWPRQPARLFDELRVAVEPARLHRIAGNDYGHQADDNYRELVQIASSGLVPCPLHQTLEVLQLERWRDAHDPRLDHPSRALACTLLLIDEAAALSTLNDGNESTLAVLVDSCIAMSAGPTFDNPDDVDDVALARTASVGDAPRLELVDAALGFLAAVADALPAGTPLVLFVELAIAILAIRRDRTDPRVVSLLARLDDDERALRAITPNATSEWLLGLTTFTARHDVWRRLAWDVPALRGRFGYITDEI